MTVIEDTIKELTNFKITKLGGLSDARERQNDVEIVFKKGRRDQNKVWHIPRRNALWIQSGIYSAGWVQGPWNRIVHGVDVCLPRSPWNLWYSHQITNRSNNRENWGSVGHPSREPQIIPWCRRFNETNHHQCVWFVLAWRNWLQHPWLHPKVSVWDAETYAFSMSQSNK